MPEDEPAGMLRAAPLFAALEEEHLAEFARRVRPHTYGREEAIFRQGDPADSMYVVGRGRVRIEYAAEEGPPLTVRFLGPGEFFGELAIFDGKARSANVVAMEPTLVLALRRDDVRDLLRISPDAADHILTVVSQRLRESGARAQELAIGRSIQTSLLAPPRLDLEGYEIRSRSEPAAEVGGDFYNVFAIRGRGSRVKGRGSRVKGQGSRVTAGYRPPSTLDP